MRTRASVLAVDAVAEQAAQSRLSQTGSAVDAVLAGFFASAGAHSGVLLSPLTLIVRGIGAGGRIFDGRSRQPGLGAKRPRGFLPEEEIPVAARVAVPRAAQALAVAHAYAGSGSLGSLARIGALAAEEAKAPGRVALFDRLAAIGAGALSEPHFVRQLLRVAGVSQKGLLTSGDFNAVTQFEVTPLDERLADGLIQAPWADEPVPEPVQNALGDPLALTAIDSLGVAAVAVYFKANNGAVLPESELLAPLLATPTLRGVPRTTPGAALPCTAPAAIQCDRSGNTLEVRSGALSQQHSALELVIRRDPITRLVEARRTSLTLAQLH